METSPSPDIPVVEVLEDCQHWFSQVLDSLFYGDGNLYKMDLPEIYYRWTATFETAHNFQKALIEQIGASEKTLKAALVVAVQNRPPVQKDFHDFLKSYEDFMGRLNGMENDSLLAGHGIDTLTGFKSHAVMMEDIKRELDRRSRRGNPYSVAMIRLDSITDVAVAEQRLKKLSAALRSCIRTFDDVYRINETDLLVSLKHSDLLGAMRFIERLKQEMKQLEADFTFTSCVAEPDPADNIDSLFQHLKKDLEQVAALGPGQSVIYEDISPLQRFVSSLKDQK